jgi:hypothetical protein
VYISSLFGSVVTSMRTYGAMNNECGFGETCDEREAMNGEVEHER